MKAWESSYKITRVDHGDCRGRADVEVLKRKLREFYKSVPSNSVARRSSFKTFCEDVPHRLARDITGLQPRSLRKAREDTKGARPSAYYLRELGTPRDRLGERRDRLLEWLQVHCVVESGSSVRRFGGTLEGTYALYCDWERASGNCPISRTTFTDVVSDCNISILPGDKFESKELVQLRAKEEQLAKITKRGERPPRRLPDDVRDLKVKDEFAKNRIEAYRRDHESLEHEEDTLVLTVDFTSSQTRMDTTFVSMVAALATREPMELPGEMLDPKVVPSQPIGKRSFVLEPTKRTHEFTRKRKRATEAEMMLRTPKRRRSSWSARCKN